MPAGVSAWTPLANTTLGSNATTVTFSSISGAYRDLVIVMSPIAVTTGNAGRMRFNGDTGSNYAWVQMIGDGSTSSSNINSSTTELVGILSETGATNTVIQIFDYAATDKFKSLVTRTNNSAANVITSAQRWNNTGAITSLALYMTGGTSYATGSTFALYGVSA